ncbi:hypothetical protein B1813_22175 [Saccharomonospora piscinae]|uniref:Uncharacterized protein n=1 Tax=Saccharomonospora piscinae TaxID=687388 RepID=A0A1V8ZXY4_SACPI|nr:hypothetical protein [Saccharomonospora piscinae]OQO89623.1 hypothetical protein B1813_22175 [Saccharomonospora piscinae]
MNSEISERSATRTRGRGLGLSWPMLCGLAALGVPRVVAHDLDLVGPVVNSVLVFLPPLVWLVVVVARSVPSPLRTLAAVGLVYGVLLAATHQLLWQRAFEGESPVLGGNLAGALPPEWEAVVVRVFAGGSSVVTGVAVGVVTGLVAWGVSALLGRADREH